MKTLESSPDFEALRDFKHPGVIVLDEIQRSEELPAMLSPEQAFCGVMCCLDQALSRDGADQLQRGLPASIRKLATACSAHEGDGEPAPIVSAEAFVARVSEHLELDPTEGRALASTVFHALHRLMSVAEVEAVARELPEELRPLWRAGDGRGDSIRSSRRD